MDPETSKPAAAQINRDNYNEDETAIHEGFMREALAMVCGLSASYLFIT
jgi:hypothetical protein